MESQPFDSRPEDLGLLRVTLSGDSLPLPKRRGLAPPNGSTCAIQRTNSIPFCQSSQDTITYCRASRMTLGDPPPIEVVP